MVKLTYNYTSITSYDAHTAAIILLANLGCYFKKGGGERRREREKEGGRESGGERGREREGERGGERERGRERERERERGGREREGERERERGRERGGEGGLGSHSLSQFSSVSLYVHRDHKDC